MYDESMRLTATLDLALQHGPSRATRDALVRYYSEAGPDYAAWSPSFNMHFGYWAWGLNPFDREAMLERTNGEVVARLDVGSGASHVADLGCGLGATARHLTRRYLRARVTGLTIVPWQVEQARRLGSERIDFVEE